MPIFSRPTYTTIVILVGYFLYSMPSMARDRHSVPECTAASLADTAVIPIEQQHLLFREFRDFCAIPNTGEPAQMEKNIQYIAGMLKSSGMDIRVLRAADIGVPPVLFAEHRVPGAKRTILYYAHYDGQPVNPASWAPGIAPFQPVLYSQPFDKGGKPIAEPAAGEPITGDIRLYARGTGDDKAGVMVIIEAYWSLLRQGKQPASNIKFLFEGEEEKGSPHLAGILAANKTLLAADDWIIADGPVHPSGKPEISFGVRGDVNVEITTYGPNRPLHSGHYGNWSPNPAWRLVQLLTSMRDTAGHVLIKDWYADVIPFTAEEKAAVDKLPRDGQELAASLGLARPEGGGETQVELLNQPSLNINGIRSADVGALSRNVIPTTATASLDLRLVLGNDWERQVQKLKLHVQSQGYYITDRDPTSEERLQHALIAKITNGVGYNAQRTSLSLPFSRELIGIVQSSTQQPLIVLPGTGGSLPLQIIEELMGVHIVIVPIANYDDNQHAENENLRLQNLWEGVHEYTVVMEKI